MTKAFSHQLQQVQGSCCWWRSEQSFAVLSMSTENTMPSVLNYICMGSCSSSHFAESSTINFMKVIQIWLPLVLLNFTNCFNGEPWYSLSSWVLMLEFTGTRLWVFFWGVPHLTICKLKLEWKAIGSNKHRCYQHMQKKGPNLSQNEVEFCHLKDRRSALAFLNCIGCPSCIDLDRRLPYSWSRNLVHFRSSVGCDCDTELLQMWWCVQVGSHLHGGTSVQWMGLQLLHLPVLLLPACLVIGPGGLVIQFCRDENRRVCSGILLLFVWFVKTGNLAVLKYSVFLWSHQICSAVMT